MDEKSIRGILVEYLKATNNDIRIYNEKSIGSSICDVMAVTDKLIGFEIKSDLDNYTRLPDQIKAYDLFFDKNYIVVSKSHISSAESKIPNHWGIILVDESGVTVKRNAPKNKGVSRRKQLSILWKIELKSLLIKNNLPLFAQKEKGFIADRIAENVESDELGLQIAHELLTRDYSVFEDSKDDDTTPNQSDDMLPVEELIDTLSETSDFSLDKWIAIYNKAKERREKKMVVYSKVEEERVPHNIPYTDITVTMGAPWISPRIINEFIFRHLCEIKSNNIPDAVSYEPITGSWSVSKTYGNHYALRTEYGLERFNGLQIIEATLNLREIKIFDGTVYNERDTIAALEKQNKIIKEFEGWVWQDEDRRWEIEEAYNKIFANYGKQKYDGSALKFPLMSPNYELYDYQKDAVQKIINSKNTLLAFDVGAGKTYIMIAAAMTMRQNGLSRKNMFVVPNHIVGQWEKIFTELYPTAKVLAIEPKTFKPDMRSKVMKQMKEGDYDGIIIAYSCFEMIPLTTETILNNMRAKIGEIDQTISSINQEMAKTKLFVWGTSPLFKEKEYIKKLTRELIDSMSPVGNGDINFEDLEINTLFLDEAHNYKNLPIRTKLKKSKRYKYKGLRKMPFYAS